MKSADRGLLIKVCGITTPEDAEFLAGCGVDFMGLIFHPRSPRYIRPAAAAQIPVYPGMKRVGVFVDTSPDDTLRIMETTCLDFVQLHGGQDREFCDAIGYEHVIKVFHPQKYAQRSRLANDLETFAPHCRYFLMDSGTSGGGHGREIEGEILSGLDFMRPWLLAGGLNPSNISSAYERHKPGGFDLNSGVEISPGLKDHLRVSRAVEIIRSIKTGGVK